MSSITFQCTDIHSYRDNAGLLFTTIDIYAILYAYSRRREIEAWQSSGLSTVLSGRCWWLTFKLAVHCTVTLDQAAFTLPLLMLRDGKTSTHVYHAPLSRSLPFSRLNITLAAKFRKGDRAPALNETTNRLTARSSLCRQNLFFHFPGLA